MVFKAVSKKTDFDAVKESTTLTGEALAKKQARDKELEAIIKGEDDRTLVVIGPCSSDNEEAVIDYAHRLAKLQEEVKDKVFMVMRVYTANLVQMVMVIKGLCTNLMLKENQTLLTELKRYVTFTTVLSLKLVLRLPMKCFIQKTLHW